MNIKECFERNGYVIIKNVFNKEEIAKLKSAVERVYSKVQEDPSSYQVRYIDETDNWGVDHIFELSLYEQEFGDVFNNKMLMDSIKEIVKEELRFWGANLLWSPKKKDYSLNWHRDFENSNFFNPSGRSTHVQFNIPLYTDSCFITIPGSHKRELSSLEKEEVTREGIGSLPGQKIIKCLPGEVLLMNAHTLHRGYCSANTFRRTLHFNVQPKSESTGGHSSYKYIREANYLQYMNPVVRRLMENLIEWEDLNPLSKAEIIRRMRFHKKRNKHKASK
ncbi:phytanoyl-CoA dioxygenase family protein [Bacillus cereus]